MRYYYEDALQAAWMHKEYGIKFYDYDEQKCVGISLSYKESAIQSFVEYGAYSAHENKFYVNPICFEMLKPQVGDLIIQRGRIRQFDKIGTVTLISKDDVCACYADYMDDARAHEGSAVMMIFSKKAEILQRNGKQFFTPERED